MLLKKRKRKIFYPIGLISLIILPLLFILYLTDNPKARTKSIMELYLMPSDYKEWFNERKEYEDVDTPPEGKWNAFVFTNDENKNSQIFYNLRTAIRIYNEQLDTLSGIEIRLNRKMPYSRFISILDMLVLEHTDRYFVINSSIWVPRYGRKINHYKFDPNILICGGVLSGPFRIEPQTWEERLKQILNLWGEEIIQVPILIIIIWVGIFILNIIRIAKLNNPNNFKRLTSVDGW